MTLSLILLSHELILQIRCALSSDILPIRISGGVYGDGERGSFDHGVLIQNVARQAAQCRRTQQEGAAMKYSAGLDVSLEETAICLVDETGNIVKEARSASEPDALAAVLLGIDMPIERIGLEACSLNAWLHGELTQAGLPVICIETR